MFKFRKNRFKDVENKNNAENIVFGELHRPQDEENDHVDNQPQIVKADAGLFLARGQCDRNDEKPDQVFNQGIEQKRHHPADEHAAYEAP